MSPFIFTFLFTLPIIFHLGYCTVQKLFLPLQRSLIMRS
nr:MAG TPA: hypothetical protein [Crassvirales sp.]